MNKRFLIVIPVLLFLLSGGLPVSARDSVREEAKVENLPPEPSEPPVIKQEVEGIRVPEGKEVILDVYTVKQGDWLIKIAKKFYDNKEYWRLIYDYNKYIKNPHWIFPGDKLIVPKIVDKLPEVPEKQVRSRTEEKKARNYGDFVAPPDFKFDGTVVGFETSKKLNAQGDVAFIDIGKNDGISENKRLHIYRQGQEVIHPYTGELIGYVYSRIGTLCVTPDIEENRSAAKIIYSKFHIVKGDMVLFAQ